MQRLGHNQPDLPASPPPVSLSEGGAPKTLWLIPILVTIAATIWVVANHLGTNVNPQSGTDILGRRFTVGDSDVLAAVREAATIARASLAMAVSVLSYIFVASLDRMMRE